MDGTPIGRRVFLGVLGVGAVGILWGAKAQDWLERTVSPIVAKDGTGLSAFLPIGRFRIYTVTGELPSKSKAEYSLKVGGLVDTPYTLTYAELRALPPTKMTKDFQCVTGWRVHDVKWQGVLLSDLLDRAGVQSRREGDPLQELRRHVHREPDPRAGPPEGRDRRLPDGGGRHLG